MSLIDEALSANATIANDYDPSRGKPPAPKIVLGYPRGRAAADFSTTSWQTWR